MCKLEKGKHLRSMPQKFDDIARHTKCRTKWKAVIDLKTHLPIEKHLKFYAFIHLQSITQIFFQRKYIVYFLQRFALIMIRWYTNIRWDQIGSFINAFDTFYLLKTSNSDNTFNCAYGCTCMPRRYWWALTRYHWHSFTVNCLFIYWSLQHVGFL